MPGLYFPEACKGDKVYSGIGFHIPCFSLNAASAEGSGVNPIPTTAKSAIFLSSMFINLSRKYHLARAIEVRMAFCECWWSWLIPPPRCHLGPKKVSISRASPSPTCPHNGSARIKNITYALVSIYLYSLLCTGSCHLTTCRLATDTSPSGQRATSPCLSPCSSAILVRWVLNKTYWRNKIPHCKWRVRENPI